MTREEIIRAISDDKMMPFIQPEQLAQIVEFVIKNYNTSLPSDLDEAAECTMPEEYGFIEIDIYGGSETVYSRVQMLAMFKAGAEWQKAKMLEKAVAVEVVGEKRDLRLIDSTQRCLFNAKRGDWMKIIIG